MKHFNAIAYLLVIISAMVACKSAIKQQDDKIYSRHLQRQVKLTVITTPMPDKKEDMNLLLLNDRELMEPLRVKTIIDSLYSQKLLKPVVVVGFEGKDENYGIAGVGGTEGKKYKQFNDFIMNELYPFIKKKVVIRKFQLVAIAGFSSSAMSAFDVAYKNDEKIGKAGIFYPDLSKENELQEIQSSRERPKFQLQLTTENTDSTTSRFLSILANKKSITTGEVSYAAPVIAGQKKIPTTANFVKFLLWAFGK